MSNANTEYRQATSYRDIIDAYHELACDGAVSIKFLAEGTATNRVSMVELVGEIEKLSGWVVERCGPLSGDIWIWKL